MACEERQERVTVFPHELYKRRLHLVKAGSVSPPIWCTVVVERGEWSRGERARGRSALRRMLASPSSSPERARRTDGRTHGRTPSRSRVGSRKRRGADRLHCMLSVNDVKVMNGVMDDGLLRYLEAE